MGKTEKDILLQKWLRGETSLEEERQLFVLAKDDPFLAEAIEGYVAYPEAEFLAAHDRIRTELPKAASRRKLRPIVWLSRVAAAVLILAVAGWAFWQVNRPEVTKTQLAEQSEPDQGVPVEDEPKQLAPDSSLALLEEDGSEPEGITQKPSSTEPKGNMDRSEKPGSARTNRRERQVEQDIAEAPAYSLEDAAVEKDYDALAPANTTVAPAPAPPKPAASIAEIDEEEIADDRIAKEEVAREQGESRKKAATEQRMAGMAKMEPAQKPDSFADIPKAVMITGTILDEQGEPLIGANVMAEGTGRGVVTDFDGRFSLTVPQPVEAIAVNFIGYTSVRVEVPPYQGLVIRLDEQNELLSEVTVTGLDAKRITKVDPAEPKGGLNKWKRYLRRNQKYPEAASKQSISGIVTLSFLLDAENRPVEIEVEQGLGYGCDEEAARLLREGPDWKAGTTSGRIAVDIPFPAE